VKVSIIVPAYNVAPYLRDCLTSVECQTVGDYECICVDDGSSDESGRILDEYVAADPHFKVLHQANAGVSAARNAALGVATGDWLLFLDGDDVLSPVTVERLLDVVRRCPQTDVVRFGLLQFAEAARPCWNLDKRDSVTIVDCRTSVGADTLGGWFAQRMYRRGILTGLDFPALRYGEDMVYMVKAMLATSYEAVIPEVCYGYRQRARSASKNIASCRYVEDISAYLKEVILLAGLSGKNISTGVLRRWCNELTEHLTFSIAQLRGRDRKQMFASVRAIWEEVFTRKSVPCRQWMRYWIFSLLPCWFSARLLFELPYRLKCAGLHR